jgi:hypothetical protein
MRTSKILSTWQLGTLATYTRRLQINHGTTGADPCFTYGCMRTVWFTCTPVDCLAHAGTLYLLATPILRVLQEAGGLKMESGL